MPQSTTTPSLSTIISSLLSAFDSSRQLYHRIRNKTQQSKSKLNKRGNSTQCFNAVAQAESQATEEQILQLHLQRAPRQIAKIYATNSGRLGERYRHGDERAKTSLNHTLLILNTGLTRIISSLLRGNNDTTSAMSQSEARRSLLSLSEKSARDALIELDGLRYRLESMTSLPLNDGRLVVPLQKGLSSAVMARQRRQRKTRLKPIAEEGQGTAVELPQPGKRATSSSTTRTQIGTLQTTTQQGKNVVKGHKKRNVVGSTSDLTRSSVDVSSNTTRADHAATTTAAARSNRSLTPNNHNVAGRKSKTQLSDSYPVWVRSKDSSTIILDTRPTYKRANTSGDNSVKQPSSRARHPASVTASFSSPNLVLSASAPSSSPSPTRNLQTPQRPDHNHQPYPPPYHPRPNLQSQAQPPRMSQLSTRPAYPLQGLEMNDDLSRRLSILTQSSASTKLGEIPQHKWINPWVPPVEVGDEGDEGGEAEGETQDTNEQGDGNEGTKSRGRVGLRFWRRLGRRSI